MALKNIIRFSTPALLFTAFLLLLLVSVSMPIAKPVWILEIASTPPAYEPKTSIATQVRFGLWGYCASAYEFGTLGGASFVRNYYCSQSKVGYSIDPVIISLLKNSDIANVVLESVTYVLIIHPISCFLTFLTVIPSTLRIYYPVEPGFVAITTLLIAIVPAIVATAAFIAEVVLVLVAQIRLNSATHGEIVLHWGPAVWMTGAAMLCLWLGVVGLSAYACGCCGIHDRRVDVLKLRYHSVKSEEDAS